MKVLFLTNIPSPYRVDFFNELGKLCDLTVLFENKSAKDRDAKWNSENFSNFNAVFMKGIRFGAAEAFCPEVLKYLSKKKFDVIVVGMYSSPTGMLAIEYMRLRKIPFILNSDGGMIKKDSFIGYKVKKHFISSASAWLSTGKATSEYLKYYGAKEENIYKYPFTSVMKKDILERPLTKEEKNIYRKKLNMQEEKIVISVGQFIHRKGYDILLKSCNNLDKNIGIYIVGGKPTEEYLSIKNELNLTNVHFIDFMKKDELGEYYKAADLFVLPTREDIWGLVINEAMAYGLPVLSTDRCIAAVEMVNENGNVVPLNADWKKEIINILESPFFENMEQNSLKIAKKYSVEKMAEQHIDIFKKFSLI